MAMTSLKSILSHSPEIVTKKISEEYVLVPVANNIADMDSVYTLNETGAFIWDLINGIRSVEEIINELITEYDIDSETATADVFEFADNLKEYLIIK